ncbi:MAG: hypothetical protein DMF03_00895 [Verrucomicrobia bacterium]|nr:MAG: hypothetical protein DMF03_00895 [Verrucomicrobiota bacterium]
MADCNGGRKTGEQSAPKGDQNPIWSIARQTVVAKRADPAGNGSNVGLIIGTGMMKTELA